MWNKTMSDLKYRIAKGCDEEGVYYYAEYRSEGCEWTPVEIVSLLYVTMPQRYKSKSGVIESIERFKAKRKREEITYEDYNG